MATVTLLTGFQKHTIYFNFPFNECCFGRCFVSIGVHIESGADIFDGLLSGFYLKWMFGIMHYFK